jgi:hypothetical protein
MPGVENPFNSWVEMIDNLPKTMEKCEKWFSRKLVLVSISVNFFHSLAGKLVDRLRDLRSPFYEPKKRN